MSEVGEAESTVGARLTRLLAARWPSEDVRVQAVRAVSAGASRLTYLVDLVRDGRPEPVVLQVQRAGAALGALDVHTQVAVLQAAQTAGVPVAAVIAWDDTDQALGAPFVLSEFIAGETLPQTILRLDSLAEARSRFAADCGRVLAALHGAPLDGLPPLEAGDQLDAVVTWIDRIGDPHPAFELAISWLGRHRPPPVEPVLVHGDFRNGNLIIGPTGLTSVLDWELTHVGDPAEDLAWVSLKTWRFRGAGEVGGMGDRVELLDAYQDAGGTVIEPDRFMWWQVLGTLKWGSICQRQASVHLDGPESSIEHAAIGRRVCEVELDLLEMLP